MRNWPFYTVHRVEDILPKAIAITLRTAIIAASFLALGTAANPIAELSDLEPRNATDEVFDKRVGGAGCRIINADVNCRSGPGTQYRVIATAKKGVLYFFTCVKSGECINIGGSVNCGWDRLSFRDFESPCFVNGHYTDNQCTVANLGKC
ncbi:hypothetical protein ACCO45_000433 [Purpureocillium lilacinum]|uniref:Uncharacterized protein n=1 Tax=Purpureocillium lilacinum TaxID=33203 RepID=A0ACC4E5L8_PURLI